MTALLELPGVKRSDLNIILSTCKYTYVRQITVAGRTTPAFADFERDEREGRAQTTRERKYGAFLRRLHVPPNTQAHDINAELENGLLILTIPLGPSIPPENPQSIPIH
ncbi:hypothetical protein EWM64_g10444 [Hericium alpestre]|uniref:SHSP domain-containing protein n=1 Tax=Hericium alpestre TaxID=135208 RepID=A0A4Y9ZIL5_9AGAM|nr:hypothetical protein EWM64_g10444 [Hericium alpestre]